MRIYKWKILREKVRKNDLDLAIDQEKSKFEDLNFFFNNSHLFWAKIRPSSWILSDNYSNWKEACFGKCVYGKGECCDTFLKVGTIWRKGKLFLHLMPAKLNVK